MSKANPVSARARAGTARRFSVSVVRKGFLKHVATLSDRVDPGFNGLEFVGMSGTAAILAAWKHAQRIVDREAEHNFDYSAI
jgi:hypothetical protein